MHYLVEIILPLMEREKVAEAVATVLAPFNENDEEASDAFWDWYVIGGRWAGAKTEAMLDPEKLEQFNAKLKEMEVKVHGLIAGKQTLVDEFVEPVDALWREMFPGAGDKCILFDHAHDKYSGDGGLPGDICLLSEVPDGHTASRVMFCSYNYENKLTCEEMLCKEVWNGVTFQDTNFDGRVKQAIEWRNERLSGRSYKEEYVERNLINDKSKWLCISVDIHS